MPGTRREYNHGYYLKNRDTILKKNRSWNASHKPKKRSHDFPREYVVRVGGLFCPICDRPYTVAGPCVDHNHVTGAVRGFICTRCNTAIGMAGDSPDILEAIADYLRSYS